MVYAIDQGNIELVKILLEAGADPNAKTQSGQVPVIQALDNPEIFKLLIKYKANLDVTDSYGNTPLVNAVQNNNIEMVKALIEAGADKNKADQAGTTPLELAKRNFYSDIEKLLADSDTSAQKEINGNKVYPVTSTEGKCSIVDAARKQMELHGLLQAQVNAGKMSSDIFRTFNEDTKDYANMLVEDPDKACKLFEKLKVKYGV